MNAKDIYKKIDDLNEAVSMNISMSGDNAEDVGNLFNMMRGDKPEMKPVDIKMLSPRDDIAKSLSIMGPKKPEMDKPMPMKLPMDPKPCGEDEVEEKSWDNSPDEDYKDQHYMTKDLSGGIDREKNQYKAANRGDNAMAMEDELRSELAKALAEKMAPADADFDESGCVGEMKKLYASGCAKHEMFKKVQDEYGCDKGKFEKLFAAHCG
jgi:hypothetical protein